MQKPDERLESQPLALGLVTPRATLSVISAARGRRSLEGGAREVPGVGRGARGWGSVRWKQGSYAGSGAPWEVQKSGFSHQALMCVFRRAFSADHGRRDSLSPRSPSRHRNTEALQLHPSHVQWGNGAGRNGMPVSIPDAHSPSQELEKRVLIC